MEAGHWTSLEIVKLLSGLMTPVALAVGGIHINRITKRFEYAQWKGQKLVEKRLAIYDDMAPMFNDLFCYFTFVGGWRDFSPPSIVAFKRALDKKIYLAAPPFTDEFFAACREFQGLCFKTFNAPGKDARLRTHLLERQAAWVGDWKSEWSNTLVPICRNHGTSLVLIAAS